MKFDKLKLIGLHTVDLPLMGALPSDPYILKGVDGLGPPEVDLSFGTTIDGVNIHQGSRPQSREIVARVGLNPDHGVGQTAAELRSSLYGMLTPGAAGHVQLDIYDGINVVATTKGHIKRLEIAPFSQTPEVQVTMPCLKTFLEAPNPLYILPGGTKAAPEIENQGTAEAGFRMGVIFTQAATSWRLDQDNGKFIEFVHDFEAGDKFIFDTRPGTRGAWLTRGLVTTNLIRALASGSSWLMLHGGVNEFASSISAYDWDDVFYLPQYWGI